MGTCDRNPKEARVKPPLTGAPNGFGTQLNPAAEPDTWAEKTKARCASGPPMNSGGPIRFSLPPTDSGASAAGGVSGSAGSRRTTVQSRS